MGLGRGVGIGNSGAWVMKFFSCHLQANGIFTAVETECSVVVPQDGRVGLNEGDTGSPTHFNKNNFASNVY